MLIYNRDLSVSPITTHLPISKVSKKIEKKIDLFFEYGKNLEKRYLSIKGINKNKFDVIT